MSTPSHKVTTQVQNITPEGFEFRRAYGLILVRVDEDARTSVRALLTTQKATPERQIAIFDSIQIPLNKQGCNEMVYSITSTELRRVKSTELRRVKMGCITSVCACLAIYNSEPTKCHNGTHTFGGSADFWREVTVVTWVRSGLQSDTPSCNASCAICMSLSRDYADRVM